MTDTIVPISPGTGTNVRTIQVTQWVVDSVTGVGAWQDVEMQVLVMADKHGDLITNEDLLGSMLAELRDIRELLEVALLKLS
jgi:hypothetical protein